MDTGVAAITIKNTPMPLNVLIIRNATEEKECIALTVY